MNIGVAKEIKSFEGRVALSPEACLRLIAQQHAVFIEQGAGLLSGYPDTEYRQLGVLVCSSAQELYQRCELIIKVKEPVAEDLDYLTAKHTLFCFLHLAANPQLADTLAGLGVTALAFESVMESKQLPLLKPMSQIAGRLAVQIGVNLLQLQQGGKGLMLGGPSDEAQQGVDSGQVLVLGAGSAGSQAALLASKMGAKVFVFDQYAAALDGIKQLDPAIQLLDDPDECRGLLASTDLLIAALLIPGERSPRFISRTQLKSMQAGSVLVDISVDQGGCVETTRATNYQQPTFVEEGVVHFCVSNMPGAVPRTATQALSALLPDYIQRLTLNNWYENDKIMRNAVNIKAGEIFVGR